MNIAMESSDAPIARGGVGALFLSCVAGLGLSTSAVQPAELPSTVAGLVVFASWWVAAILTAWLLLSLMVWSAALRSGRSGSGVHCVLRLVTVPGSRRIAEGLLAATLVAVPAACAAGPSEVAAPRLEVLRPSQSSVGVEVEAAPSPSVLSSVSPPTTRATAPPATPSTTVPSSPVPTPDGPGGSSMGPVVVPASGTVLTRPTERVVVDGDNLWSVAADELSAAWDRPVTDAEITVYWVELVRSNRELIRSGNPNLIYPGEVLVLPPTDAP